MEDDIFAKYRKKRPTSLTPSTTDSTDIFAKYRSPTKQPVQTEVPIAPETERQQMIARGEPVSTQKRFERTGKTTPSMGGSLVRGLANLPLKIAASGKSAVNALEGKDINEDLKVNEYFGKIERIGKGFDITKGLTKENKKAIIDAVGTGAEAASYLIGAKPLTSLGGTAIKQLTKQEIRKKILKEALRVAKYEATAGGLGAGGFAAQEGKDLKGIIKDAIIGAGLGGALGLGLGGLGAKLKLGKEAKVLEEVVPEVPPTMPPPSGPGAPPVTPGVATEVASVVPGVGEVVPSTRGETVLRAAVEKKLIDAMDIEGEVPTHVRENVTQWANDADEYIKQNPDSYMDVAMGKKSHPNAEAVYTAAEIKAVQEGDVAKIMELSKSSVPTEAGRGLKKLDSADPNSPVKIIRDVTKAREEAATKTVRGKNIRKARETVIKKGKAEVKTARMKIAEAQSLLDQLVC